MKPNYFKLISLVLSVFYTLTIFLPIGSSPILSASKNLNRNPIIYRRYIRRGPPMHPSDQYTDEVIEIFHTKRRPPPTVDIMTDEDVDRFIFCDFNRELEECKRYWESRKAKKPIEEIIKIPAVAETTTSKVEPTIRSAEATTNSLTTTSTSATKVNLPLLPNIPEPVDDSDVENYDEEDQTPLKNDVVILKENEPDNDEDVYVDEDETENDNENENDYENNDENNNIFS